MPMDNLLRYPQSCIVDRIVPKTMFYRHMEVNPRIKQRFVNDVERITWLYKLSAQTLNVSASEGMEEVEVMVVDLKADDCPTDLFQFIDINMPHHLVFVLRYGSHSMLLLNYKEWTDASHTKFRIVQSFATPWVEASELSLAIEGQTIARIYENFVAQVGQIGTHRTGTLAEVVELKKQIAAKEKEIKSLESKMRREPQFSRQMELNQQVKVLRKELSALENNLNNYTI